MELICAKTGETSLNDETIVEMHFACGHVETLCLAARRSWSEFSSHHPLVKEIELLQTRIWCLRQLVKHGQDKIIELMGFVAKLQGLESDLFDLASNWLKED